MGDKQIDINSLTYLDNYTNDISKRERLYPLFERVFGIHTSTLRDFSNKGLWNDKYIPFTFFDGDRAVANVSAFPLSMNINGKFINCYGIQSVMTDQDYRSKGLMKRLFQMMLDEMNSLYEGAILFTNSPELYTPYGFKTIKQYYFKKKLKLNKFKPESSLLKLDPLIELEHLEIINKVFDKKQPLSNVFAPISYLKCLYFNFYNPWIYEKLFFIEEIETILVFEVSDGILKIFDVMGENMPSLEILCSYIPYDFHSIEFYFHPDMFDVVDGEVIEYQTQNKLMVRGSFDLENQRLMMPLTAEF
ncbi:GNAT family N-acetyltransferase [Bacillus sp. FJAT-49736]|uniref:GNAT family N-acetyltransferase n=1 Tax=Bacillus sp. FJAT-49736 TaxID=2833582 RepID=UPI001BCA2368|nr:GNAT family N-acetyltransferase [Bacillus sp. FJAT-49736]MBS4175600.1 GNAT family N-acetyltransferase [Bacillus sp. FJAT-49736]